MGTPEKKSGRHACGLVVACLLLAALATPGRGAEDAAYALRDTFEGDTLRDEVSGATSHASSIDPIAGVNGLGRRFVFDYKAGIASRVEIPVTDGLKTLHAKGFSVEWWFSPNEVRYAMMLESDGAWLRGDAA